VFFVKSVCTTNVLVNEKVKKGGLLMSHKIFCHRNRYAARSSSTAVTSGSNMGFRCAKSLLI
jgi:hypothetical protein